MGFPLAPDAFPRVQLAPNDQAELEALVDALVTDTLRECNELQARSTAPHVDSLRWRLLKHRDNVRVYKERSSYLHARLERSHQQRPNQHAVDALDDSEWQQQQPMLPMMMGVGSVQGTVDDVVYGLLSHTQEMAQIRSAYVGDDIVDAQVLASLARPSLSDPLRSLSIKWCAKRHNGVCRSLVRYRDFVFVEATGVARDPRSGDRVGFHVVHSVAVPGVRELHELNVVRARISMCCLFQQARDRSVELFMQGFLNPLGDVRLSAAMASAAESVVAIWKTVRCAQMKKLAWEATTSAARPARGSASATCEVCWKAPRASLHSLRACQVCRKRVCSRCCVPEKLHFLSPTRAAVVQTAVLFCSGCVFAATQTSALELAVRESALQDAPGCRSVTTVAAQTPCSATSSSTRSRAFTSPKSDWSCISSSASSCYAGAEPSPRFPYPCTPGGRALLSSRSSRFSRWFH